jgi:antitoxin VapB
MGQSGVRCGSRSRYIEHQQATIYIMDYTTLEASMTHVAKLFKNGRSQAVRLPAEFRFEGSEVEIRRDSETGDVILSPRKQVASWEEFFRLRDAIPKEDLKDFMKDREQGTQERDDIFDDL